MNVRIYFIKLTIPRRAPENRQLEEFGASTPLKRKIYCKWVGGTAEGITIRRQLGKMKRRKAADDGGIVAELLFEGVDILIEIIADIFSDVLNPRMAIPEY